jgi:BirA family biotin operon repressor/biotin-[acetyl-CoA-carboxylase] ligase
MLSCLVALAIHETISFYINSTNKIKIKWPNDILVNNAKISGVLIENVLSGKKKYSIIGIGINVVSSPQLADYETSFINQYLNDKTDVSKIFLNLKNNLEDKLNNYSEVNIDDIRLEMLSKSWKFNEKIEFISNSLSGSGIFEGISDNYEILIRTDTDQIRLNSGELKLIRK